MLVTEYMEKGDLCTALSRSPAKFAWDRLGRSVAMDVARGLAFLHSRNVVRIPPLALGNAHSILLHKHWPCRFLSASYRESDTWKWPLVAGVDAWEGAKHVIGGVWQRGGG